MKCCSTWYLYHGVVALCARGLDKKKRPSDSDTVISLAHDKQSWLRAYSNGLQSKQKLLATMLIRFAIDTTIVVKKKKMLACEIKPP